MSDEQDREINYLLDSLGAASLKAQKYHNELLYAKAQLAFYVDAYENAMAVISNFNKVLDGREGAYKTNLVILAKIIPELAKRENWTYNAADGWHLSLGHSNFNPHIHAVCILETIKLLCPAALADTTGAPN